MQAGIAIQKVFAEARGRRLARTSIRVRIGIHVGPAIEKGGDYFGRNVAMAARVAAEVADVELKGFDGPHTLWSVELPG